MSKLRQALHFLAVYLVLYLCIALVVIGKGIVEALVGSLLLLGIGFFGGVNLLAFSVSAIHSLNFTLLLFSMNIVAIAVFFYGLKRRSALWGKILNAAAFYVFCIVGFVALAPSA